MAIYEYCCIEHGRFERKAHFGNALPHFPCPYCGELVGRVFSVPQIRFVGTGWTVKDKSHEFDKKFPQLDRMSK